MKANPKANRLAPKKGPASVPVKPGEALPAQVQACCDALNLTAEDLLSWAMHPGEVVLVLASGIKVRMTAGANGAA